MSNLSSYFVHYEYTCWKCPEQHEGTATIEALGPEDAQERFENETIGWDDWPGVDGWDYDTKVIGVSWRP